MDTESFGTREHTAFELVGEEKIREAPDNPGSSGKWSFEVFNTHNNVNSDANFQFE